MALPRHLQPLFFIFALASIACQPKIGDSCITDQECSGETQRLCDTTQLGGYCTIVDCDPTVCPEKESVCVSFNNVRSTVGACNNPGITSPYRRNFCMKFCEESKDCRDGYACVNVEEENAFGAAVIQEPPDKKRASKRVVPNKICIMAQSHPSIEDDRSDMVCTGYTADETGGGGAGGAVGAGGASSP